MNKFCITLACMIYAALIDNTLYADDTAKPENLVICADELGYAPYTFDLPGSRGTARGFNLDILQAILSEQQITFQVLMRPWLRCLAMAEQGEADLVLDVADTPARRQIFLLPESHYGVHIGLIALKNKRDLIQTIESGEQIHQIRVCELPGWLSPFRDVENYSPAGQPHDLESSTMMLNNNRCDAGVYSPEVFVGSLQTGTFPPEIGDSFEYHLLPWRPVQRHYFGISKAAPFAESLKALFDWSIVGLKNNGTLDLLLRNYLPEDVADPANSL